MPLSAGIVSLEGLIRDDFFVVPTFQRRYAWESSEVRRFLGELWLYSSLTPAAVPEAHFLGTIALLDPPDRGSHAGCRRSDGQAARAVVDGQQRLVTCTMLLAALRDRIGTSEPWLADLVASQNDDGGRSERVEALGADHEFLAEAIIPEGATLKEQDIAGRESHIVTARAIINEDFAGRTPEQLAALAHHLRDRCGFAVIASQSLDQSLEIFASINARGRKLSNSDVLKAEVMAALPPDAVARVSQEWEEKRDLVREEYDRLGSYIQHSRTNAGNSILVDLRQLIQREGALGFFDGIFAPTADRLHQILSADFTGEGADAANLALRHLNSLPSTEWVPPVLVYLQQFGPGAAFGRFAAQLDRFALGLTLRNLGYDKRVLRHRDIIRQLRAGNAEPSAIPALTLDPEDQKAILRRLDEDPHSLNAQACKALICRLSGIFAQGPLPYSYKLLSVEHVLPKRPAKGSLWLALFPNKAEREELSGKLGNLVLMFSAQNGSIGNGEYADKRAAYFRDGAPSEFAITNDLWPVEQWTPTAIRDRHTVLMEQVRASLGLTV